MLNNFQSLKNAILIQLNFHLVF